MDYNLFVQEFPITSLVEGEKQNVNVNVIRNSTTPKTNNEQQMQAATWKNGRQQVLRRLLEPPHRFFHAHLSKNHRHKIPLDDGDTTVGYKKKYGLTHGTSCTGPSGPTRRSHGACTGTFRGKGLSQDDAGGGGGRRENTCAWFRAKTKSSSIRGLAGEA